MQRKVERVLLFFVLTGILFLVGRPLLHRPHTAPAGPDVFDPLTFSWEALPAALTFLAREPERIPDIQKLSQDHDHPPLRYLSALIHLSAGGVDEAESDFKRIAPASIPGVFRYAPYRLHLERHPGRPNPHASPILSSASAGELPPLIAARVFVIESRFTQALEAYLTSDPAD